jgi:hypothetical protein
MWTLINQTPFAAERTFVTDERGADVMLVLVKASYHLMPDGRTEVAPQQLPVCFEPRFRGDPHASSLLSESDLDFPKRTTDVLLVGSAHAPGGVPCTAVEVSMQVGPMRKALRVVGDRVWSSGLLGPRPGPPVPFVTMPITYERAFGGREQGSPTQFEPRNPVGTGFARHAEGMPGQPVANVSYAGHEFARWDDRPAPAGFGPVARHWQPRAGHAGTFDLAWEQERFPLRPLDFDLRFHQSAPADQQPATFLKGNEPVELRNLTPSGHLAFRLPYESLVFRSRLDGALVDQPAQLYAVVLEPDVSRLVMLWASALPCHGKKYRLERTVVLRKPRVTLASLPSRAVAHG